MRSHVERMDTNTMDWVVRDKPGAFSKPLSSDPETGARTSLQRIDAAHGYVAPAMPHFHHMDEELFVLKGPFTFDGETWLGPMSYVYHPAQTVHGFHSQLPGEAWYISRVSKELDFNFEENPRGDQPYSLTGETPRRGVRIVVDPFVEHWEEVRDGAGTLLFSRLILSEDPQTHEGSALIRYAPGFRHAAPHTHPVYQEIFVCEGAIEPDEGEPLGAGCYTFRPPGTHISAWSAPAGALVYMNYGGVLEHTPLATQPGQ
jgi:quercetin dioxygenase-like cupin family protein